MAKYCNHCGKEVHEDAVICVNCGCSLVQTYSKQNSNPGTIVNAISERYKINAIIWLAIGVLQFLVGLFTYGFILVVGILNIVMSVQDLNFSKEFAQKPVGVVEKVKPLTAPIITLIYNLIFGGVIGVAGSIYYFVGIRNYVLQNEQTLTDIEKEQIVCNS